ncbi:TPA_asm: hypothetical protein GZX72_14555 [Listeria monocytogenes]|nr:hypothetical protein [Listeria monocytogenes]
MNTKTDVEVTLTGEDGNIFNLLGITTNALKQAGYRDYAKELQSRIMNESSYESAIRLISEYVKIV